MADNGMLLMNASKYYPEACIPQIRKMLDEDPEGFASTMAMSSAKDPFVVLMISIFIGGLGIDRFYLGDYGLGVLKLLTGGGCGLWWFIDLFLVMNRAKEINWRNLMMYRS